MKNWICLALVTTLIGACSTYDPYTGERETSKTAAGAGIGAGVAAVLAYLENRNEDSDERRRRILQAAAGGAAVGGGIGFYMDRQEAKLRQQLRNSGVSVQREGDNINLIMPGNITFDTDSAHIKSDFYDVLNSVALVVNEFNRTVIVVAGHTDNTGSDAYNQNLSQRRAASVASYLGNQNVLRERLDTVGFGESHPIASNDSPAGRQENRRVEITLVPLQAG